MKSILSLRVNAWPLRVCGLSRICRARPALAVLAFCTLGLSHFGFSSAAALAQDVKDAVLDGPAMLGAKSTTAAQDGLATEKTRTRFVIGLERSVDFQVSSLENPNRVIVELPDVKLQLPTLPANTPLGLVKSFRWGLTGSGKASVIIDVTGPVIVEKALIEKHAERGHTAQLVLDIVSVEANAKAAKAGNKSFLGMVASNLGLTGVQPPIPRRAQRPDAYSANVFRPIIVIDPGHGGHDSGAQKHGTVEKDVVLAFSLRLRDKLQESGRYKVLMTRDDDRFVELDERRAFADRSKAALFIAVHADYAGADARGATIYSLRDSTANELQRSAKRDVSADVLSAAELEKVKSTSGDIGAVKGFLADLAVKEVAVNKERTKMFAGTVVETMGETTNMMNNPDREAGFRVLKSAKMPSVLIELAYVTNRADAANLNSDSWRDRVSGSIVSALDNYFSHHESRLPM